MNEIHRLFVETPCQPDKQSLITSWTKHDNTTWPQNKNLDLTLKRELIRSHYFQIIYFFIFIFLFSDILFWSLNPLIQLFSGKQPQLLISKTTFRGQMFFFQPLSLAQACRWELEPRSTDGFKFLPCVIILFSVTLTDTLMIRGNSVPCLCCRRTFSLVSTNRHWDQV